MRLTPAFFLLTIAVPATGQVVSDDDGRARASAESVDPPMRSRPLRSDAPGRQTARTAYGYRLTAAEDDDYDPTDRRVLRRLNTRLNNRLETRIERYRFVDTRSERAGTSTRNPYERSAGTAPNSALSARSAGVGMGLDTDAARPPAQRRPPEDSR